MSGDRTEDQVRGSGEEETKRFYILQFMTKKSGGNCKLTVYYSNSRPKHKLNCDVDTDATND